MAVTVWWIFEHSKIESDLTLFMPEAANSTEEMLLHDLGGGPVSRLVLMSIEGGSEGDRAAASSQLAQRLQTSGLFRFVLNGAEIVSREHWQKLFEYRYLLTPSAAGLRFTVDELRAALMSRLQDLKSPIAGFHKKLVAMDPTADVLALEQQLGAVSTPGRRLGVWFSTDGRRALLMAQTLGKAFDLDLQGRVVEEINNAFKTIGEATDTRIQLAGPGVFAVNSQNIIRKESTRLTVAASMLVILVLYSGYRSLPLLIYGGLPIVTAMVAGVWVVNLFYGSIHGLTLAFGVTLLGMTIDYPIHLFSHLSAGENPLHSLKRIWATLGLSAVTTAIGFLAMVTTGFRGLAQLGLFTVTGLTTAILFTRFLLPRLPGLTINPIPISAVLARVLMRDRRYASVVAGILVITGLVYIATRHDLLWEEDLAALSPVPVDLISLDRELRRQLGAPEVSQLLLLTASDVERLLQLSERFEPSLSVLRERGIITGADLVSRILPSQATQRERQARLPEQNLLRRNLEQAMTGLPFREGAFEPFLAAVNRSKMLSPLQPKDLAGTALDSSVSSLLFPNGLQWSMIAPLRGVRDPAIMAAAFSDHALPGVQYIDLKQKSNNLVSRFRDQALQRLMFGACAVLLVLYLGLRSARSVFKILFPVVLALVLDLVILLWLGYRLSLFHLISLLLVLGISLDYSLFINRVEENSVIRTQTFHALTICAATTVSVFGVLALSAIPVLNAIGATVSIGVLVGYLGALFMAAAPSPHFSPGGPDKLRTL